MIITLNLMVLLRTGVAQNLSVTFRASAGHTWYQHNDTEGRLSFPLSAMFFSVESLTYSLLNMARSISAPVKRCLGSSTDTVTVGADTVLCSACCLMGSVRGRPKKKATQQCASKLTAHSGSCVIRSSAARRTTPPCGVASNAKPSSILVTVVRSTCHNCRARVQRRRLVVGFSTLFLKLAAGRYISFCLLSGDERIRVIPIGGH